MTIKDYETRTVKKKREQKVETDPEPQVEEVEEEPKNKNFPCPWCGKEGSRVSQTFMSRKANIRRRRRICNHCRRKFTTSETVI